MMAVMAFVVEPVYAQAVPVYASFLCIQLCYLLTTKLNQIHCFKSPSNYHVGYGLFSWYTKQVYNLRVKPAEHIDDGC